MFVDVHFARALERRADGRAVLQLAGHDGAEVTNCVFSPDGSRLYVSSQRGTDGDGMTFEITGRFARR